MIPKIIHYCWLSNDPYPSKIQRCINSWKKYLPDYEIMLWNFDRFPRGTALWVDQAFDNHKYAFAADYIRLYALRNYGGIYLDSDVEVLKTFDDLLDLPYFLGHENSPNGIEAAVLGCEKGWPLIDSLYKEYEGKSFVDENGVMDVDEMPKKFKKCINTYYCLNDISSKEEFIRTPHVVNIFPIDWFSPMTWDTHELTVTHNTYTIHHFAGSWIERPTRWNLFKIFISKLPIIKQLYSLFMVNK